MIKKFVFIIIVIMCFGCTANYKLVIKDDMSIKESITGLEDEKFYNSFSSSKSEVIKNVLYSVNEFLINHNYSFDEVSNKSKYGATVSKKYKDFDDFVTNSKAYLQLYNKLNYNNEDGIITILLDDKVKWNGVNLERYIVDDGTVSIFLPFKVLEHNADSYSNGKYVWNVNSNNDKTIMIKFDTNKKVSNKDSSIYLTFIFIVIIGIVSFGIISIYKKKNRTRNDF